jgi:hypothetical protein
MAALDLWQEFERAPGESATLPDDLHAQLLELTSVINLHVPPLLAQPLDHRISLDPPERGLPTANELTSRINTSRLYLVKENLADWHAG